MCFLDDYISNNESIYNRVYGCLGWLLTVYVKMAQVVGYSNVIWAPMQLFAFDQLT